MRVKIIITILVFLTSVIVANASTGEEAVTQRNTSSTSSDNQWIEVGEVTLYRYGRYDTIDKLDYPNNRWIRHQGILYAYYIGERMLYKVNIKGKMYTIIRFSSDDYDYKEFNGRVIINVKSWYLTVPSW